MGQSCVGNWINPGAAPTLEVTSGIFNQYLPTVEVNVGATELYAFLSPPNSCVAVAKFSTGVNSLPRLFRAAYDCAAPWVEWVTTTIAHSPPTH